MMKKGREKKIKERKMKREEKKGEGIFWTTPEKWLSFSSLLLNLIPVNLNLKVKIFPHE